MVWQTHVYQYLSTDPKRVSLPRASSLFTLRDVFRKYQRMPRKTIMMNGSGMRMYGLAAEATMMMAKNRRRS